MHRMSITTNSKFSRQHLITFRDIILKEHRRKHFDCHYTSLYIEMMRSDVIDWIIAKVGRGARQHA